MEVPHQRETRSRSHSAMMGWKCDTKGIYYAVSSTCPQGGGRRVWSMGNLRLNKAAKEKGERQNTSGDCLCLGVCHLTLQKHQTDLRPLGRSWGRSCLSSARFCSAVSWERHPRKKIELWRYATIYKLLLSGQGEKTSPFERFYF